MLGGDVGLLDDFEARITRLERLLDRALPVLCNPGLTVDSATLIREIRVEITDNRLSKPTA